MDGGLFDLDWAKAAQDLPPGQPDFSGLLGGLQAQPVQPAQVKAMVDSAPPAASPQGPAGGNQSNWWDRLKTAASTPNDQGFTWGDRLYALGSVMRGDTQGAQAYIGDIRNRKRDAALLAQQEQTRRGLNQAFLAAQETDPATGRTRFNRAKYQAAAQALPGVNVADIVKTATEFGPKFVQVGKNAGYVNPLSEAEGVDWVAPPPPSEEDLADKDAARAEREARTAYYRAQGQYVPYRAETARISANRPRAGGAGAAGGIGQLSTADIVKALRGGR